MTVIEIVKKYLAENKLDGLVNQYLGCGCSVGDVGQCGECIQECEAAVRTLCTKECDHEGIEDVHHFAPAETTDTTSMAEHERKILLTALETIECTGAPGATIVAKRSDEHCCVWCRGMSTPCPVEIARNAIGKVSIR